MKPLFASRRNLSIALTLALGAFAIATSAAPAVAKDRHAASHASRLGYAYAPANAGSASSSDLGEATASRSAALRECNKEAEKYSFSTWQTAQFAVYGSCMANHGQPSG
jgi:hypothetical protein